MEGHGRKPSVDEKILLWTLTLERNKYLSLSIIKDKNIWVRGSSLEFALVRDWFSRVIGLFQSDPSVFKGLLLAIYNWRGRKMDRYCISTC